MEGATGAKMCNNMKQLYTVALLRRGNHGNSATGQPLAHWSCYSKWNVYINTYVPPTVHVLTVQYDLTTNPSQYHYTVAVT